MVGFDMAGSRAGREFSTKTVLEGYGSTVAVLAGHVMTPLDLAQMVAVDWVTLADDSLVVRRDSYVLGGGLQLNAEVVP